MDNKSLTVSVKITDMEEFEEFKNIVLKILKDERIDFLVREEYWNKVMNWIERTYPSEEYKQKYHLIIGGSYESSNICR